MAKDKKDKPKPVPKLETSPDKFNDIKYVIPSENDKPNEGETWQDYFYGAYNGLQGLNAIDLATSEGEDKLHGILNNPGMTKSWDSEKLSGAKDRLVQRVNSGLMGNSLNNLESLVGVFEGAKQEAGNLALGLPAFYAQDSSDSYKSTAKAISEAQRIAESSQDPKAYVFSKLKDFDKENPSYSHLFWMSYANEIAQADARISQIMAVRAMNEFGSEQKFLLESLKTAKTLSERASKGELEFRKAIQAYGESSDGYLTAEQQRTFIESYKKDNAEAYGAYEQAMGAQQSIGKMIGTVQSQAYRLIDSRKKEAEAKAKK